jgi:hypothetical protein
MSEQLDDLLGCLRDNPPDGSLAGFEREVIRRLDGRRFDRRSMDLPLYAGSVFAALLLGLTTGEVLASAATPASRVGVDITADARMAPSSLLNDQP